MCRRPLLAYLLADKKYKIDSVNDLTNANDVNIVCEENTHKVNALKVSLIKIYHQVNVL
jgi:hypothetical protein